MWKNLPLNSINIFANVIPHGPLNISEINLLENWAITRTVAIISEAHSTEYFEKGIRENTLKDYHWGGKTIRGKLLAALLLMGDELDLQQARSIIIWFTMRTKQ